MTTLDLGTVLLLHKTSLLAGACALLLLWRRADRPPGVLALALSFLLLAAGAFLAGLGEVGAIPLYVWQDSSMALATGAYGLFFLGAWRLDRPIRRLRWVLLSAPAILLVGLATPVFQDNTTRASAFHAVAVLANGLASLGIVGHARREPLPSRLPLALALGTCAVIYAMQIPLLLAGLATPGSLALGFSATMMLNFVIAALVVSFVRERREEVQRRAAATDALTGVHNRHGFLQVVPERVEPSAALLLFDLDHFKRINDRFGHAGGDRALARFARLVGDRLGEGDVLARIGGEEFVVFLGEGGEARAVRLAEEIRLATARLDASWRGEPIALTTSVGVAVAREGGSARDALLARADAALYRAKASGRNRVDVAREEAEPSAIVHRLARRVTRAAG